MDYLNGEYKPSRGHLIGNVNSQMFFDQSLPNVKSALYFKEQKKSYYKMILDKIVRKFNAQYNTNFKINLLTIREDIERCRSVGINNMPDYSASGGYYDPNSEEIIIFFDKIWEFSKLDSSKDHGLTYLIFAAFHELQHRIQFTKLNEVNVKDTIATRTKGVSELYRFMIASEVLFLTLPGDKLDFYNKYHDNMLFEIDADINGIRNAYAFCDEEFSSFKDSPIDYSYYGNFNKYNEYRLAIYNMQFFFERLMKNIEYYPSIITQRKLSSCNALVYEFFDNRGNFKPVSQIMNNPIIKSGNQAIVKIIMSSSYYIKNLDYMSEQERKFVLKYASETLIDLILIEDTEMYHKSDAIKIIYNFRAFAKGNNSNNNLTSYETVDPIIDYDYYDMLRQAVYKYDPNFGR